MTIGRTPLWRGQQRVDVPHLRAAESGILADFDALAGNVMAGQRALVVRGFAIEMDNAIGASAEALRLNIADAAMIHPLASDAGSVFCVPADAAFETLSSSNARVEGSFTASTVNYVGLDLVREEDDDTIDTVMFLDPVSGEETAQRVALARTLDFRIVVSAVDFSSTPNVCPIAKVTTGANNQVTAVEDARQMLFRLGSGGSAPDPYYSFPWAEGRIEGAASTSDAFYGGDKSIGSLKGLIEAIQTRVWEIGGGQHWYSASSDRELKVIYGPGVLANGDNFMWTLGSQTLEWGDLTVVFANSDGQLNEIADDTAVLADGECLYVDIDRSQDLTGVDALTPQVADWETLGSPDVPGTRFVLAWRLGNYVYARDKDYEVGRTFVAASPSVLGIVKLTYAAADPLEPKVAAQDANGRIHNTALGGNAAGFEGTGNGTGAGVRGTGGSTSGRGGDFIGGATGGIGVVGTGTGGGFGVSGVGGATNAPGVKGTGGGTTGDGVQGIGATDGDGVVGVGNGVGVGVKGTGGDTNGPGVRGTGGGAGAGVEAIAGATGVAVNATGGSLGAILATVTGSANPPGTASWAVKQRNATTSNDTKVLTAWLHGAPDGFDDGFALFSDRIAEDDVELSFASIVDGVVGSPTMTFAVDETRAMVDLSMVGADILLDTGHLEVGTAAGRVDGEGAQYVNALGRAISTAFGGQASRVISGGNFKYDGATITLGPGTFRFANGTVLTNAAAITLNPTLGAPEAPKFVYLKTDATLVATSTPPVALGHDGDTSRCYVGSYMYDDSSDTGCRVHTIAPGIRYVTMNPSSGLDILGYLGNTTSPTATISGAFTHNMLSASAGAGTTAARTALPTALSLVWSIGLWATPNIANPSLSGSGGLLKYSSAGCGLYGGVNLPTAASWTESNGAALSTTKIGSMATMFVANTQNPGSGPTLNVSIGQGAEWKVSATTSVVAYIEDVNNPTPWA